MGEGCELFLEKSFYTPGDIITGRVHCHFLNETDVRNIYLRFKGKAKVFWKRGKVSYSDEEIYFEMESPLLQDKTTFPAGDYDYPFSFNLKCNIPSSAVGKHGEIKYSATAVVDRPLAFDYKSEKEFVVIAPTIPFLNEHQLTTTETHVPFLALFSSNPLKLTVRVNKRNFNVSEMVVFSAKLENLTSMNVKEVQFKLVQGFSYYANDSTTSSSDWEGQDYAIIDSSVPATSEKSWDLELRVPTNIFAGDLSFCKVMKAFWELRGEVVLPFPHKNFKIKIPITVGITT